MDQELISMNVRLEGEVQGVGLRDFCVREANNRGLKGWVRNRSDGTVEMVVAGLRGDVEAYIAVCITGPGGAKVTAFNMQPTELPTSIGFTRRPSL
jgi:acylphosphatase